MDVDWLTNSDWLKVFVITPTILLFLILCVLANIKNLLEEFNGRNKNSVHLLESALGITYAQTAQTNPEGIIQKLDEIIDSTHAAKTTLARGF